jgi:hypothetical protein
MACICRHHIKERNDHKLRSIGATFLHSESRKCNRGRDPDYRNRNAERKAKPAEPPVKLHIPGRDQSGFFCPSNGQPAVNPRSRFIRTNRAQSSVLAPTNKSVIRLENNQRVSVLEACDYKPNWDAIRLGMLRKTPNEANRSVPIT